MPTIVEEGGSSSKYDSYDKRVIVWPVSLRRATSATAPQPLPPLPRRRRPCTPTSAWVVWCPAQVYIDKKKTIADGRKIPKEDCVDYPQMGELKEVLDHLGFSYAYEVCARATSSAPRSGALARASGGMPGS